MASQFAVLVSGERISPIAPITSSTPMVLTARIGMRSTHPIIG